MILGLVFSRDRALQLEAALTSFLRHALDGNSAELAVLYLASSPRHQSQYFELAQQYDQRVHFVPETSFRSQLFEILGSISRSEPIRPRYAWLEELRSKVSPEARRVTEPTDFVLFLVDDSLFVRSFRLGAALEALSSNPDAVGFSLRLGRNTTHCYVLGREQSLPGFQSLPDGVLRYNWTQSDGDFGYPLEISSSIYPLQPIVGMLERLSFSDPNTLETQMSLQRRRFVQHLPTLLCYEQSVTFSAPLNRVQQVYRNRAADVSEFSTETLADRFDQGQRINIVALDGFVPSACHQEVGLDFEHRIP